VHWSTLLIHAAIYSFGSLAAAYTAIRRWLLPRIRRLTDLIESITELPNSQKELTRVVVQIVADSTMRFSRIESLLVQVCTLAGVPYGKER
jgi:hypothetical protein